MNNDCTHCRVPVLVIQKTSVSLESLLARLLYTLLWYSSVGAVLVEFMDLCVCYDLIVLQYLSKPNKVVFL